MEEFRGIQLVHQVKVKDALKAIQKYTEERIDKIETQMLKKLEEEIGPERLNAIQRMKDMRPDEDCKVPIEEFEEFVKSESELYDMYYESLESDTGEMIRELESMVQDSSKFFKAKFWDPIDQDVEFQPQVSRINRKTAAFIIYTSVFIFCVACDVLYAGVFKKTLYSWPVISILCWIKSILPGTC